jgi:thiol-disulfide isomerase/thioredoxin
MNLELLKRPVVIAVALAVIVAGLVVLYVIPSGPVHAPPSLAVLAAEQPGAPVPDVAFTDGNGKRHLLSEFRGHYVLLNLWATWCAPCVKELPALQRLQDGMAGSNFVIVPVNVGRADALDTAKFLTAHDAGKLSVNVDTTLALMRTLHVYGLPVTVILDPKGREIARAEGPAVWDDPEAVAYFKDLSARPPS